MQDARERRRRDRQHGLRGLWQHMWRAGNEAAAASAASAAAAAAEGSAPRERGPRPLEPSLAGASAAATSAAAPLPGQYQVRCPSLVLGHSCTPGLQSLPFIPLKENSIWCSGQGPGVPQVLPCQHPRC